MMFLADTSESLEVVESEIGMPTGELLTPLTNRKWKGRRFGIDNGAFANFDPKGFRSLLNRNEVNKASCIFVAIPDVVGSAIRTLEVFEHWHQEIANLGYPTALVAQDGQEFLPIPWARIAAIFIGGSTQWKMGPSARAIIKAGKAMEKWVHVGRVNTPCRLDYVRDMGADSCDGTGLSRYSHMRQAVMGWKDGPPIFASCAEGGLGVPSNSLQAPDGRDMPNAEEAKIKDAK